MDQQCNVVYKIPCKDCPWNYIGETGRSFRTRKKEHLRNLKNYIKGSNVANHAWHNNHSIDFDNACVIDKGNYRVRKTLESWHTEKRPARIITPNRCLGNIQFYYNFIPFTRFSFSFYISYCIIFLHIFCIYLCLAHVFIIRERL